ncbi:MAG: alcohol dehydrogenase [Amycolatopsis sp.]|jgi:2-desacetyl-2-hydroxyethyl bacteriochlorophyllide A dehydrogenase|uniref:alcohol dehydrogenase catalytic domain-containing protein n=1 Tax=Amycolatopsis sp. TaxID=37632 RepID=UPI002639E3C1|nr:alcohol dehydrogenase catalytic domain-containing protein [Amycolatopsis sp.]MCU1679985.1 alcohol dehydrogenase [Amycolatopsis sp.]
MSTKMKAAVLHAPRDVRVDDVDVPSISDPNDVLIKVEMSAICGTDLHPYEGRIEIEGGVVLGHEFLGTVVDAGEAVGLVEPGDRAVASCVVNCGHCWTCRRGDPGRCVGSRIFGLGIALGDLAGAQAEYVVVPNADLTLRKLPEEIRSSDEDLLFVGDIMTTGYEAVRRAIQPGDVVAIVGAGPVGLCAAMSAIALGASATIVVDKIASRLKEAERLGAIPINADEADPVDVVLELTGWRGANVVIDAVGHESALVSACNLLAAGGTLSVPGVYMEESVNIPFGDLWLKGVKIVTGVANIVNYMDEVIQLTEAGKLSPAGIISHRMGLSEAPEAYRMFEAHEATKIVLDPSR